MNKKKLVFPVILLLTLLIVWMGYKFSTRQTLEQSSDPNISQKQDADVQNDMATNAITTDGVNGANGEIQFETGVENLPRSLQGTEVDGEIIIDSNQNLVVTHGLKRLFDYFLSTLGEEDAETINARVEAYITHRTPEPAASSAVEIYRQYIEYLKQLSELQNKYGNLQMQATESGELDLNLARQRQQDIQNLRRSIFDEATIKAFFTTDDELFDYNVAMIELAQNETLTEEQRAAAKRDYLSRMPDSLIKKNAEQQANMQELMQRTEELQRRGASDAELFAMRAELVGIPAAERLAKVDEENRDFDARFEQYQAQKNTIIANESNKTLQQQKIAQLESQLFDEAEQKRLTGYAQLKELETKD